MATIRHILNGNTSGISLGGVSIPSGESRPVDMEKLTPGEHKQAERWYELGWISAAPDPADVEAPPLFPVPITHQMPVVHPPPPEGLPGPDGTPPAPAGVPGVNAPPPPPRAPTTPPPPPPPPPPAR